MSRDVKGNAIFRTITVADWKRSHALAKVQRNVVRDRIVAALRARIEEGRRLWPEVIGPFFP